MVPYLSVEVRDSVGNVIIPLDHEWAAKIMAGTNLVDEYGVRTKKAEKIVLVRGDEAERELQVTPASVFAMCLSEFAAEISEQTDIGETTKAEGFNNRLAWAIGLFRGHTTKDVSLSTQIKDNTNNFALMSAIIDLYKK